MWDILRYGMYLMDKSTDDRRNYHVDLLIHGIYPGLITQWSKPKPLFKPPVLNKKVTIIRKLNEFWNQAVNYSVGKGKLDTKERFLVKTTGLTGLAVSKNPHQTLKSIYERTIKILHKMPQEAAYRQHTEDIVRTKLQHVQTEPVIATLEQKINCGQIEEVIIQADNELKLARKMLKWKPWEPLIGEAPPNQWRWPV